MASKGFLNAFIIKAIMLVLMLLDHIHYYIFPQRLHFAHILARVVAPVFAFFVAQGMVYTRSRERYIARIFTFAAIMALGNILFESLTKTGIPNNIFLSLGIGAAMVYLIDKMSTAPVTNDLFRKTSLKDCEQTQRTILSPTIKEAGSYPLYIALFAILVILSLYCEGQYLAPVSVVIFYLFRHNKTTMYAVYILFSGFPFLISYAFTGELQTQFYMIFAIIPLMLYNGRRGPDNAFSKYLFYVFYPLHIWLIVILKSLLF